MDPKKGKVLVLRELTVMGETTCPQLHTNKSLAEKMERKRKAPELKGLPVGEGNLGWDLKEVREAGRWR